MISATCDAGLTPGRAVEAAKQGKLIEGEPFTMSQSYAYQLQQNERRKRAGNAGEVANSPNAALNGLERIGVRMVRSLDALERAWERRGAARKVDELTRLAKAGQEVRKLLEPLPNGRRSIPPSADPTGAQGNGELGKIMEAHEQTNGTPNTASAARTSAREAVAKQAQQEAQHRTATDFRRALAGSDNGP